MPARNSPTSPPKSDIPACTLNPVGLHDNIYAMKPLQTWLRGAVNPPLSRRCTWLARGSLALLVATSFGCDPAADKSSTKKEEESDSSAQSSDDTKQSSDGGDLESFAKAFADRYEKINVYACETNSDYCIESLKKAEPEDIEMSFFLAFEGEDLKSSQYADYLDCFTKSLNASNRCVEDCEDQDDDDDDETECSKSSMLKCMNKFREDQLDECDVPEASAEDLFETAMVGLNERLNPSDDGG